MKNKNKNWRKKLFLSKLHFSFSPLHFPGCCPSWFLAFCSLDPACTTHYVPYEIWQMTYQTDHAWFMRKFKCFTEIVPMNYPNVTFITSKKCLLHINGIQVSPIEIKPFLVKCVVPVFHVFMFDNSSSKTHIFLYKMFHSRLSLSTICITCIIQCTICLKFPCTIQCTVRDF